MRVFKYIGTALFSLLLFSGCGGISKQYSFVNIPSDNKENKNIEVSIEPTNASMRAGYSAFLLKIKNNTSEDLELDWNKTYFIKNGSTNGTFMFEGIIYKDRNNQKSNDVIFSKSIFTKTIYPNNYVVFNSAGRYSSWGHNGTGEGTQGAYLTILNGDKKIKLKALVKIK